MGSPICPGCGGHQVHLEGCLDADQRILMRVVELYIEASYIDWIVETRESLTANQKERLRKHARAKRDDADRWERG